ncbi:MAG: S41 family peptidase [Bacillota bacterium]|nr:S41 family peptidase [Bacillota bacterium]
MKKYKTLVTIIATFLVTSLMWVSVYNYMYAGDENLRKIETAYNIIKNNFVLDYDKNFVKDFTIAAMVESLRDKYSAFYPKEYYEQLSNGIEGHYYGIGVTVSADTKTGKLIVNDVQKDTPAGRAGIEAGDTILKVGDTPVNADNYQKAVDMIRGDENGEGTKVGLTLLRGTTENQYTVSVAREKIISSTVEGEMLENGIAYIKIKKFDNETSNEFAQKLLDIGVDNVKYLILDLRDNGGGTIYSTRLIASMLLPKCVITQFKYKNGSSTDIKTTGKQVLTAPMCVLVNGGSASASEVLTSALRDNKRAIVIGEQTFGKGIAQVTIPFETENGKTVSALYLTYAHYLTPNGEDIHGKGLKPDIIVKTPEKYKNIEVSKWDRKEDTQFLKAMEKAKESIK